MKPPVMPLYQRLIWSFAGVLTTVVLWNLWVEPRLEDPTAHLSADTSDAATQLSRGAYLAHLGDCVACHTERGGAPFAGGRAIPTPFGTVFSSNLTPSAEHGLGAWNADDFWRAMHHGRSRDGRLLNPAFPYANFTRTTREDSDALFAFLRSQPATEQPNRAHELRFPYNTQLALRVWRALYFKPASFAPTAGQSAEWNRGAYLVQGLGHCGACHTPRNALGASERGAELTGAVIPGQKWVAPALAIPTDAIADTARYLQTGVGRVSFAQGPMAEVVYRSTQHLSNADARAVAVYLNSLPAPERKAPAPAPDEVDTAWVQRGAAVYDAHCADCHGTQGQGVPGVYPALAGNPHVSQGSAANLQQVVLNGGFAPTTAGHARPYGMPPFRATLSDLDIAAVLTYVRRSWGHQAPAVAEIDIKLAR